MMYILVVMDEELSSNEAGETVGAIRRRWLVKISEQNHDGFVDWSQWTNIYPA